jgi:hypothetical protein
LLSSRQGSDKELKKRERMKMKRFGEDGSESIELSQREQRH